MKRITKKAATLTVAATIAVTGIGFVPYQGTFAVEAATQFAFKTFNYKVISGQTTTQTGQAKGIMADGTLYIPLSLAGKLTGNSTSGDKTYANVTVKLDSYPKSNEDKQLAKENLEKLQKENASLKAQLASAQDIKDGKAKVGEDGWIIMETSHFTFHYTKKSWADYRWFYDNVETIWGIENKFFGGNTVWKDKVDFWVADDQGYFAGDSSANYDPGRNAIRLAPYGLANVGSDPHFVLTHELVHAFQFHLWSKVGDSHGATIFAGLNNQVNWLLEGQADYVAKEIYGLKQYDYEKAGAARDKTFYTQELKQRSGKGGPSAIDWVNLSSFANLDQNRNNYFSFESVMFFLEQQYGHDKYLTFYNDLGETKDSLDQALRKAFGKGDTDLVKEYKAFYGIDANF